MVHVRGGISVIISDKDILVPFPGSALDSHQHCFVRTERQAYLVIIARMSRTSIPRSDPDIGLVVRKGTNQRLNGRIVLDGIDADHVARAVQMDASCACIFGVLVCLLPGRIEMLHEKRVALQSGRFTDLHDSQIATSADDVAKIEEVVA